MTLELTPIGLIHGPWKTVDECPPYSRSRTDRFELEIFAEYAPALTSVETCSHLLILYWMHLACRERLTQGYRWDDRPHGTFALRSPHRPNPVAVATCELLQRRGRILTVTGLDCVDGTPLLDIKPCFAGIDGNPEATVGWWENRAFRSE